MPKKKRKPLSITDALGLPQKGMLGNEEIELHESMFKPISIIKKGNKTKKPNLG